MEYCAASDALTFAPEGFNEFFNQRRRWIPSTIANIYDLLKDYKNVVSVNESISIWSVSLPHLLHLLQVHLLPSDHVGLLHPWSWNHFPHGRRSHLHFLQYRLVTLLSSFIMMIISRYQLVLGHRCSSRRLLLHRLSHCDTRKTTSCRTSHRSLIRNADDSCRCGNFASNSEGRNPLSSFHFPLCSHCQVKDN